MTITNKDEQCSAGQDRCQFELLERDQTMNCITADPIEPFDIKYRMNVVEKMSSTDAVENQQEAFKCSYICRTDLCNSLDNFAKVVFSSFEHCFYPSNCFSG